MERMVESVGSGRELGASNRHGWTPVMYASYCGHDDIVEFLIDNSVSMVEKNERGRTAIMLAAMCGNDAVAEVLILRGGGRIKSNLRHAVQSFFSEAYFGRSRERLVAIDGSRRLFRTLSRRHLRARPFRQTASRLRRRPECSRGGGQGFQSTDGGCRGGTRVGRPIAAEDGRRP